MNDLQIVAELLGVDDGDAMIVLGLCDWVDHEIAIAMYGYPRDNVIAPPVAERLADPDYLDRLVAAAQADDEVPREIVDLLVAKRAASR